MLKQSIPALYSSLSENLAQLRYLMHEITPLVASVAVVPDVKKNEPRNALFPIQPQHFRASDAARKAAESYLDLHIKDGLCTKTARRSVGAILFSPDITPMAWEIPPCIERINSDKDAIKQLLLEHYEERYQRFDALREHCPGIMALHLYRQIRCINQAGVSKVSFTWQRKAALVRPSRENIVKIIDREICHASPERAEGLVELMKAVMSIPSKDLRLRRLVQPQPSANVWFESSKATMTAPMPILVVQNTPMDIKPLPDFDPAVPPKNRQADKLETREIGVVRGISVEQIVH